jgi:ABC-2 type transport system permease protein
MTATARVRAEFGAAWRSFVRRRTAVFFTFFFPVILIVIFGALVRTDPGGGGLFTEPPEYYLAGYLAVVVMFTPLSRVGSTVARHREGVRFEKLATTPLSRTEWLLAHTLVNVVLVGAASAVLLVVLLLITDAQFVLSPLLVPFVALGTALFCGFGALLGRIADSQDGVIAAANTVALPMLFLAETFVPPALLPGWMHPVIDLLPLTYFARGVRAATTGGPWIADLVVLSVLAVAFLLAGAYAIPRTD